MAMRHTLNERHPVFGGWIKLHDEDLLQPGDETGCVSTLLNPSSSEGWRPIWLSAVGKSVREVCDYQGDVDGKERLFRRRVPVQVSQLSELLAAAEDVLDAYDNDRMLGGPMQGLRKACQKVRREEQR